MDNVSDHQLLVLIALVNREYEAERPAADVDERSIRLNDEGARRWGDTVMDHLAEYVTRHRMTGDEFVAWARRDGRGWLRRQLDA